MEAVRGASAVISAADKAKVWAVYRHGFDYVDVEAINDMGIILTTGLASARKRGSTGCSSACDCALE